jgi:hypothetical protein
VAKPGVFDSILNALGGPNKIVTKDPTTGQSVVTDGPPDRKRAIAHIFAGALEGMFAGLQHAQGPGGALKALGAGGEAGIKLGQEEAAAPQKAADAANARQAALTKQQQDAQLFQHKIMASNLDIAAKGRQAYNMGEDAKDKLIATSADQLQKWHDEEDASGAHIFLRDHVPYSQYLQEYQQPGANHGTTYAHLIDGKTPIIDPKTGEPKTDKDGNVLTEYTVAVVDPKATVKVPAEVVDEAARTGYPVPGYTPGSHEGDFQMSALDAANLMHHHAGVSNFESAVGEVNKTLGLNGGNALDANKLLQTNPQLGAAMYPLAQHWDGRPESLASALQKMQAPDKNGKVNQANASAALAITAALGGGEQLSRFDATAKGNVKAAEELPEDQQKAALKNAGENANAQRAEGRANAKQQQKDAATQGYVEMPDGRTMISNKAAAEAAGYPFQEMKPGDINKDKTAMRMLNDVQLNTSRYTRAAQVYANPQTQLTYHGKPVSPQNPVYTQGKLSLIGIKNSIKDPDSLRASDTQNFNVLMNKAGYADINASISAGGHIELPVLTAYGESLSREINSEAYNELSDQAKDMYDGYVRTMSSIPMYQKAVTQIGRLPETMMNLELANIAHPGMGAANVVRKQQQFQENIARVSQGFPENMVGVPHPSQVRREVESQGQQPAPAAAAQPGGGAKTDPFAAFGGKLRTPAAAPAETGNQ